jgi:hypothetical protein
MRDLPALDAVARAAREDGGSIDEILARLREEGASPVASMAVLNHVLGIGLKESKPIVWRSKVWADLLPAQRQLEAELLQSFEDRSDS